MLLLKSSGGTHSNCIHKSTSPGLISTGAIKSAGSASPAQNAAETIVLNRESPCEISDTMRHQPNPYGRHDPWSLVRLPSTPGLQHYFFNSDNWSYDRPLVTCLVALTHLHSLQHHLWRTGVVWLGQGNNGVQTTVPSLALSSSGCSPIPLDSPESCLAMMRQSARRDVLRWDCVARTPISSSVGFIFSFRFPPWLL